MQPRRPHLITGDEWDHTWETDGGTATQRRADRSALPPAPRASYEPQVLRERLKPILDELKDTLQSFEGEPTPDDYRWLRGQLRKLVACLDLP